MVEKGKGSAKIENGNAYAAAQTDKALPGSKAGCNRM
jgi:hypothetical protein